MPMQKARHVIAKCNMSRPKLENFRSYRHLNAQNRVDINEPMLPKFSFSFLKIIPVRKKLVEILYSSRICPGEAFFFLLFHHQRKKILFSPPPLGHFQSFLSVKS
jgi:hypothetical protein